MTFSRRWLHRCYYHQCGNLRTAFQHHLDWADCTSDPHVWGPTGAPVSSDRALLVKTQNIAPDLKSMSSAKPTVYPRSADFLPHRVDRFHQHYLSGYRLLTCRRVGNRFVEPVLALPTPWVLPGGNLPRSTTSAFRSDLRPSAIQFPP